MVEVMKIMVTSLKGSHSCTAALSAPTDPGLHQRILNIHMQVRGSLLWGHCSFLLAPAAQGSLCPPKVCFPVLCKLWQLYGGVNGNLLQEDLCHTQVCCTQSPCPCNRPPLTRTSTGSQFNWLFGYKI